MVNPENYCYESPLSMKKHYGAIILILLLVSIFTSCNKSLPNKEFKKGNLLYNPTIPNTLVEKTGNFLVEQHFFTDDNPTTIVLEQTKDTFLLIIVVEKLYLTDTSYDYAFRQLAQKAQINLFDKRPTFAELADRNLKIARRIR